MMSYVQSHIGKTVTFQNIQENFKKDEISNTFSFSDTNNNIYNLNNANVCRHLTLFKL